MDYEQKYKEALERARQIQNTPYTAHWDVMKEVVEAVFPELAESKIERIRKWLICTLKSLNNSPVQIDGAYEMMLPAINWLEKQGEQKPADKVEPKFHEGDWVVQENIGTYKVVEVCESWYEVIDSQNNHYSIGFDKEYMCHLWTIEDVKDGDVLVGNYDNCKKPWIGIFKCISKDRPTTQFDSYCFLNSSHHIFTTALSCDFYNQCKGHTIRYTLPATKEQRDLLFQKMKEAGYEWDAEKKELKKIEQNPAWSGEDEIGFCDAMWAIEQARTTAKDENDMGNLWYAERWLKSLKSRVQPLPKQEWSKEDESMLYGVIETEQYMLDVVNGIKKFDVGNGNIRKACAEELNWLKSLKDRVQPKQEWKQENTDDLTDFENAMMHIGGSFFGEHAGLDPNDTNAIKEQANLLLELVPSKEWSEEDENRVNRLIAYFEDKESFTAEDDIVYANWLKSLRPQNTWKPSDEQMGVIEAVINNRSFLRRHLDSLYEQLKKLRKE